MYSRVIISFICFFTSLFLANHAVAFSLFGSKSQHTDPSGRVARLSYIKGDVSFSPAAAKNNVWLSGRVNRPLVTGDRIWVDSNARAELQLGNAVLRLKEKTTARIINLNDQLAQVELSQGSIMLHVRQVPAGQTYEIDTPQLAFRVTQKGYYRIDVSDNGDATIVRVRKGDGFVYAKNAAYKVNALQTYRFSGKNLQMQIIALNISDGFDKWAQERETRTSKSNSIKYVSASMIGYEDLDNYGNWRYTPEYGYVWAPRHVSADWAPYRYGHWSWIDPWGWTWIDDQPWGFAPSHYGRWAHYKHVWVWVPGPRVAEVSYAPALVVFVGGSKHSIMVNSKPAVAWFPLGPQDVYVPPYTVSETYFTNINVTNTTVNKVYVTKVYQNHIVQTNYTNYQINNAITAVPSKSFAESQPVARSAVPVPTFVTGQAAPISSAPIIAPAETAVATGYEVSSSKPSESTLERVSVVVTAPPTSTVPVVQVSAPAEASTPVVTTGKETGSYVEGTYNGEVQPNIEKPAEATKVQADNEAAEKIEQDKKSVEVTTAKVEVAAKDEALKPEVVKEKADQVAADASKEAAQAAAKQQAALQAEAEKVAAEKSEAEQKAAALRSNAEAEKVASERAESDRQTAEAEQKATAERAAAKAEAEQQATQHVEAEKAAAERAESDRQTAAAAKAEAEQKAAERAEAEKANAEQAESQRQAAEAAAKAEAGQKAAERAEAEKAAAVRAEAEQAAAAKAQAERQAAEQAAANAAAAASAAAAANAQQQVAAPQQPPAAPTS